jgi:mannosyltransferase
MRGRWKNLSLGLLILIAFALRVYRLSAQDIWGDEAFSIWLSQQPLNVVAAGASDTHPPLFPFLLFLWLPLVGASAFATRALSALIGVLAVPLIFVFVRRLTARPRVAWFAAIFAAVSPLLIYYSQETRMYELVAVLALASWYFAARFVGATDRPPLLGAYFVSTVLAIYTHYSAFFVIAAQNLFAVVRLYKNRAALIRWFVGQIALALAYVPWIIVQTSFLRGKASTRFDEWGWRGIEMIFGKTFLSFSIGLTVDAPLAQVATLVFLTIAVLGVIAMGRAGTTGQSSLQPARATNPSPLLALLYFSVPIVVAYIVNPVMPFFFERYVLVALPGFIVLVALGLDYLIQRDARLALGLGGILLLYNAFALDQYYFNDAYAKGKYGQMMAYVSTNAQPGDALVLNNPLQKPLYRYYAPRELPAFFLPDGDASLEDPQMRAQLETIARQHSRVWLVMFGNPAEYDPTGYLERWLGAHAFKTLERGFVDAALSLYLMPSAQPAVPRELRATLGENIQLIGYALDRADIAPGQALLLTLHWQATAPIAKNYTVFAHIIGRMNPTMQSPVWAQMDSEPVGGSRPTTSWRVGEMIEDRYGLLLPLNMPPGEYWIEIGMYDPTTLARVPMFDANGKRVEEDRVILGAVRVAAR